MSFFDQSDEYKELMGVVAGVFERCENSSLDLFDSSEEELNSISTWNERATVLITTFYNLCSNNGRVYPHLELGLSIRTELEAVGAVSTIAALDKLNELQKTMGELDDCPAIDKIENSIPGDFEWAKPVYEFYLRRK